MVIKIIQVMGEIFTIYERKIPLIKIHKKILQNEVKWLRDTPAFVNVESTDLMKYFKTSLKTS